MLDKPKTIPLKELIIKRIAVKMRINETTIDAVVNHQFKELIKSMATSNSIELSGFGTFLFLEKKAQAYLKAQKESLEKLGRGEKIKAGKTAEDLEKDIIYLENKLNHARASKTDSRRVEEYNN